MNQKEKALEQYNILKLLDPKMALFLNGKIEAGHSPTFGVANGKALSIPQPRYPVGMTWSGSVTVEVMIDGEGKVTSAHALDGPAEFRKVTEEAAMKARFQPTKLSGTPVAVNGRLVYNFVRQ